MTKVYPQFNFKLKSPRDPNFSVKGQGKNVRKTEVVSNSQAPGLKLGVSGAKWGSPQKPQRTYVSMRAPSKVGLCPSKPQLRISEGWGEGQGQGPHIFLCPFWLKNVLQTDVSSSYVPPTTVSPNPQAFGAVSFSFGDISSWYVSKYPSIMTPLHSGTFHLYMSSKCPTVDCYRDSSSFHLTVLYMRTY